MQKVLKEKGRIFCAFIDLKNTFDNFCVNGLWYKLFKLGLNSKMLRIIEDMYNEVKTCVKLFDAFVGSILSYSCEI